MSTAVSCANPLSFAIPSGKTRQKINYGKCNIIKAVSADSRSNLDHLQRATQLQHQQQQPLKQSQLPPKRRIVQSAPLGLWDRFPSARTLQQMMDAMDRIIEDPFAYSTTPLPSISGEDTFGGYRRGRIPWEIKEGEGEYKMRFDMPGMTKKDVKVYLEENMLVIKAEKEPKKDKEGGEADDEEWSATSYGRYHSRIALPDNVITENIKAEVKDGVLYITIPKVSASSKIVAIDVQ